MYGTHMCVSGRLNIQSPSLTSSYSSDVHKTMTSHHLHASRPGRKDCWSKPNLKGDGNTILTTSHALGKFRANLKFPAIHQHHADLPKASKGYQKGTNHPKRSLIAKAVLIQTLLQTLLCCSKGVLKPGFEIRLADWTPVLMWTTSLLGGVDERKHV